MSADEHKPQEPAAGMDNTPAEDPFRAFDIPNRPDAAAEKKPLRFNRRTRNLLIAVAIAVLLAVLLLLVTLLPNENAVGSSSNTSDTPIEETGYTLVDKSAISKTNQISEVEVKNTQGSFTIAFDQSISNYVLVGYEDLPLSENADTLLENSTTLNASAKIAQVNSLADFGLDAPSATAFIRYKDGTAATLYIGNETPSKEGCYVRMDDSQEVYVLIADTANYYLAADWWYISTTIMSAPLMREDDENGAAIMQSLTVTGTKHPHRLSLRRVQDSDSMEYKYFKYVTTEPFLRGVTDEVGDILYGTTTLYAERAAILHPTAAQLKKYGFDNPYTVAKIVLAIESTATSENSETGEEETVDIVYNNTEYTITVGCLDADGNYVVMVDGIDAIYIVAQDTLAQIVERQHENTTSATLFLKDITTLSRIEITTDGQKHVFDLSHNALAEEADDKLTVKIGDKTYDTADFRNLYTMMMALQRYRVLNTQPTGEPILSLTLYDLEEKPYFSADFFENANGSLSDCRTSDGEIFSVKSSTVTKLLTYTNAYVNGEDVPNT